ncbi:MAG TPA: MarR family transcriptional regulator [Galbitalea sp.]|jgi:DNA-binding MarR family transcriptional regulator|nr:MarR family transcriptional regulator [Galbitalea sp.]
MTDFLTLHGKTNKAVRSLAEEGMLKHGLHLGQNLLLAVLWEEDGRTPGQIAAAVEVTTPAVVKMANRMVSSGLIERRPDGRDNRLVRLWLTDTGRALQRPVENERQRLEARLTADLTAEERRILLVALAKVYRAASEGLDRG